MVKCSHLWLFLWLQTADTLLDFSIACSGAGFWLNIVFLQIYTGKVWKVWHFFIILFYCCFANFHDHFIQRVCGPMSLLFLSINFYIVFWQLWHLFLFLLPVGFSNMFIITNVLAWRTCVDFCALTVYHLSYDVVLHFISQLRMCQFLFWLAWVPPKLGVGGPRMRWDFFWCIAVSYTNYALLFHHLLI